MTLLGPDDPPPARVVNALTEQPTWVLGVGWLAVGALLAAGARVVLHRTLSPEQRTAAIAV